MNTLPSLQNFIIWVIPTLFAITLHEVAHGLVAYKLGDRTAYMMGRLSLNPLKHIDLLGTILIPGLLFLTGNMLFGWAKPVPINTRYLRNYKRDTILVAIAGPLSNFIMAIAWALLTKLAIECNDNSTENFLFLLTNIGIAGIQINLMLMLFNLLPIPPLDGSHVLARLLPIRLSYAYENIKAYGFIILIILIQLGITNSILSPLFNVLMNAIFSLFNINFY
ncbi:MAG: Peptidase family protein [Francisellaceae bacterium]|nr:Peptidase family protein [Francisellaceae bacterium]